MEVSVLDDADFDAIQWFDLSAVGKLSDFNQLCCLQHSINKVGVRISRMRYLGGLQVLLTFKKETESIEFVKDRQTWARWFASLEIWTGQLQVEDEEWCPGWIDKMDKIQIVAHNLVTSDEVGHEPLEQNEVEQPNQIGGDQSPVHEENLNSQLVSSPLEELGISSSDGCFHTPGEQMAECGDIRIDNICLAEVEATIKIGKELGANLDNFQELVE
ncbi:hypothetical protein L1987_15931 [Smallanthus sonchifolius]|uniref:Uncharacterized protein n=1 Tax=Smallanthus sonchifolius TaxID=185202 RepID=A0ACB9J8G9_9ASTR|nr:hypothetical protein L1987_15931 [Smallanthus sonchifolius]